MDEDEIRKSAALEQRHWWYSGRRALVRRLLKDVPPGRALDVGCGMGGNSAVLRDLGWDVVALDYSPASIEAARSRGLTVLRGDARRLPFADQEFDLVISTDAWEHVVEDDQVAAETFRVLRPGGQALVAVPAGMDLWSGHDVALGHHRRYERAELVALVAAAGFRVDEVFGWNVLLRPVARMRRRNNAGESEMEHVNPVLNAALRSIVATESVLPVGNRRGISLVLRASRT
ncbi:MAG: methyltransferase [Marmoricola sp.]|nr:methyltransferase [Marmoricola sp.]